MVSFADHVQESIPEYIARGWNYATGDEDETQELELTSILGSESQSELEDVWAPRENTKPLIAVPSEKS